MVKNLKHKSSQLEYKMPPSIQPTPARKTEANNSFAGERTIGSSSHDFFNSTVPPMAWKFAGGEAQPLSDLSAETASATSITGSPTKDKRVAGNGMERPLPESLSVRDRNPHSSESYMAHGSPPWPTSFPPNYPATVSPMGYNPSHTPTHSASEQFPIGVTIPSQHSLSEISSTNWPHYYPHLSPQYDKVTGQSLYERYQQYQAERKAQEVELLRAATESENAARQSNEELVKAATSLVEENARDALMARLEAARSKVSQANAKRQEAAGISRPTAEDRWESFREAKFIYDNKLKAPEEYTEPFCKFMTENPTVWHAVSAFEDKLTKSGFKKVCGCSLPHNLLLT